MLARNLVEPIVTEVAPPAPRFDEDLLADLAVYASTTGALTFGRGDRVAGRVLRARGHVCWAAAEGMGARLPALIAASCRVPDARARVADVLRACLRDRTPLAEALAAAGLATQPVLKAAMRRHT